MSTTVQDSLEGTVGSSQAATSDSVDAVTITTEEVDTGVDHMTVLSNQNTDSESMPMPSVTSLLTQPGGKLTPL